MIPKVIHYCWFGGAPLPKLALECIESWKTLCPDYEIIEWNENNFDVNCCEYVKQAYEAKKWAFVSDYARFKIISENGGVYFDTDVKLIKDITPIIEKGPYLGLETDQRVNAGLGFAAESGDMLCQEMLCHYHSSSFVNEDGSYNLLTVVERLTEILEKHGSINPQEITEIAGCHIYPSEYFSPIDVVSKKCVITENTVSVHYFMGSWCDAKSRFRGKLYALINRLFGEKIALSLRKKFGRKDAQN